MVGKLVLQNVGFDVVDVCLGCCFQNLGSVLCCL